MTARGLWMREKSPAVYILASKRNGTLYVGVTSDFVDRISLHKQHMIEGFSKRYGVDRLVHIEFHEDMAKAIAREKQLKRWRGGWKMALIEKENPVGGISTGRCRACRRYDRHPGQGGAMAPTRAGIQRKTRATHTSEARRIPAWTMG